MLQPRYNSILMVGLLNGLARAHFWGGRPLTIRPHSTPSRDVLSLSTRQRVLLQVLRGGSSMVDDEDSDEEGYVTAAEDESEDESESEEEEEAPAPTNTTATSSAAKPPIPVTIKTHTNSKILDQSIELPTVKRSRTIQSIKQSVSRQLPSRPPMQAIQILHEGHILDDETLIEDILDEEDEDEEEDDEQSGLVLYLDMIPPVDPKFVPELDRKLNDWTTSELLAAYAINEAAIHQNTILITQDEDREEDEDSDDDEEEEDAEERLTAAPSTPVNAAIKQRAEKIQRDLEATILNTDSAKRLLAEPLPPNQQAKHGVEIRGNRQRDIAGGGANLKRNFQRNFNVEDWQTTIKHMLLFLFFGWFGGRTALSRNLLFAGAPAMIVLNFRGVKFFLRTLLYALFLHPPSIILSLLPAPQQAILSLNVQTAMRNVYGQYLPGSEKEDEAPSELDDDLDDATIDALIDEEGDEDSEYDYSDDSDDFSDSD